MTDDRIEGGFKMAEREWAGGLTEDACRRAPRGVRRAAAAPRSLVGQLKVSTDGWGTWR